VRSMPLVAPLKRSRAFLAPRDPDNPPVLGNGQVVGR
jgi:hypothetical protein